MRARVDGAGRLEDAIGERRLAVVGGCEFSVSAPWGEMHLLGYFLPGESEELDAFLVRCRTDRVRRAQEMVRLLLGDGRHDRLR